MILRRLDDDGAARGQRGAELADGQVDRVVPRDDQRSHADRLGDRQVEAGARVEAPVTCPRAAGPHRRRTAACRRRRPTSRTREQADRLAHLARDQLRQRLDVRLEAVGELEQHRRAVGRALRLPRRQRGAGRLDGAIDQLGVGLGRARQHGAVVAGDHVERRRTGDPLAADQVAYVDHARTSTMVSMAPSSSSSEMTSGGESFRTLPWRPLAPTIRPRSRSASRACACVLRARRLAAELDAHEQAAAAHLADPRVAREPGAQPADRAVAQHARALDQALVEQHVDGRAGGALVEGVREEGRGRRVAAPGGHHVVGAQHGGQRQAAADALADRHQVGRDAVDAGSPTWRRRGRTRTGSRRTPAARRAGRRARAGRPGSPAAGSARRRCPGSARSRSRPPDRRRWPGRRAPARRGRAPSRRRRHRAPRVSGTGRGTAGTARRRGAPTGSR